MPIHLLPYNPRTWTGAPDPQFRRSVWDDIAELRAKLNELLTLVNNGTYGGDMTKAVYDTDNDGAVNDSEQLGGVAASDYARRDTDNEFAATTTQTVGGLLEATANNASENIVARWIGINAGNTDAGDGIDFYDEFGAGPDTNIRRISNTSGILSFTKFSGTDASAYQYYFDGTVTAPDLKLTASIADPSGYTVSNPPTQAEVQAILTTLQNIYAALK